jgi:hypothetical protein
MEEISVTVSKVDGGFIVWDSVANEQRVMTSLNKTMSYVKAQLSAKTEAV